MSRALHDLSLPELVSVSGLKRVHVLAWRDLADAEAGGSEVHIDAIAQRWADAGVDVVMRTSHAPGQPETQTRNGYRVIRRGSRYSVFPRAIAAELTGRHGPVDGLVEIWNGVPWLSPMWARTPRMVWMHHIHGPMWKMSLPAPIAPVGEIMERRLAPPFYRRTPICTLGESSKAEMIQHLGWQPAQIHVISPGIDPAFRPGTARSATPLIVAVGRLMPAKHFEVLVAQIGPLRQRFPGLSLVIVGEGQERARLEADIARLGVGDSVRLAGRVTEVELIALYQEAWLITAASEAEGWGMTLTEAAACGTPAVATDIAGHRDAVTNGTTGLLVNAERLGDAVAGLLADPQRRDQLGAGALARAATLTWDAAARRTFHVLAAESERRRKT